METLWLRKKWTKIDDIYIQSIKNFLKNNIFQNIVFIFDKDSNTDNILIRIMKKLIENSKDLLFQPIFIYIGSNNKNTSYLG